MTPATAPRAWFVVASLAVMACRSGERPLRSRHARSPEQPRDASSAITLREAVNQGERWVPAGRVRALLVGSCCAVTTSPSVIYRALDECPASLLVDGDARARTGAEAEDELVWACRGDPGVLLAILARPNIGRPGSALSTDMLAPGAAVTLRSADGELSAVVVDVSSDRFTIRVLSEDPRARPRMPPATETVAVLSSTGTLAGVVEHCEPDRAMATVVAASAIARLMTGCGPRSPAAECAPSKPAILQLQEFFSNWREAIVGGFFGVMGVLVSVLYRRRKRRAAPR